jgi:cyclopropane fatty-acyl-phospholipid synthase-like methyltransferase
MKSFLNPEKILDQLDLKADMLAAEFGCGPGNFVIALAKRLDEGLVYGLDIQEEPLSSQKIRTLLENKPMFSLSAAIWKVQKALLCLILLWI